MLAFNRIHKYERATQVQWGDDCGLMTHKEACTKLRYNRRDRYDVDALWARARAGEDVREEAIRTYREIKKSQRVNASGLAMATKKLAFHNVDEVHLKALLSAIKQGQRFDAGEAARLPQTSAITDDDLCLPFKRIYLEATVTTQDALARIWVEDEVFARKAQAANINLKQGNMRLMMTLAPACEVEHEHIANAASKAPDIDHALALTLMWRGTFKHRQRPSNEVYLARHGAVFWADQRGRRKLSVQCVALSMDDHFHAGMFDYRNVDLAMVTKAVMVAADFLCCINQGQAVFNSSEEIKRTEAPKGKPRKYKRTEHKILVLKTDPAYHRRPTDPLVKRRNSPRFHLRRAHWRRYRDDSGAVLYKRWIEAQWVGDKSQGKITKDYALPSAVRRYEVAP